MNVDPLDDVENLMQLLKSARIVACQYGRRFALRREEEADLQGELLLRAVQKRHLFDPEKASWPHWLNILLGNCARNFGEARVAKKRDARREILLPSA